MSQQVLFLDRDGIINVNHGYVHSPDQFQWVDGILTLCHAAQVANYRIIIVTNQSGIAREYYSRQQYRSFARWIEHQFWQHGITITQTYHCPHHPRRGNAYCQPCTCRKPHPGMLVRAARHWNIDMQRSLMVGDSLSDMQAALRAGVKHGILFRAEPRLGHPTLYRDRQKPYYHCSQLSAITRLL